MKNTTYWLALALVTLAPTLAHADGFDCTGRDTGIEVKIYNNTDPSLGTRTPAILIVSDPSRDYGDRTIATFKNEQITYEGYGTYFATTDTVDRRPTADAQVLENSRLGHLENILLKMNFSYAEQLFSELTKKPASFSGSVFYQQTSGATRNESVRCTHYLKDPDQDSDQTN
jgi:hypothetical protein